MNKIVIRLDDITPDMNWENFYKVKEILDKHHVLPLIGVVPDNQDELLHCDEIRPDFWKTIRNLQGDGWAIAQHGYQHIYETTEKGLLGINPFSEFAGLSFEHQSEKLAKGQKILKEEGIKTDIFMPPGHTYDCNTIKALVNARFRYLSDGYCNQPYWYMGLCFFPCKMMESYKSKGIDTLCFHLNNKNDAAIQEFDSFIEKNRNYICDYDCTVLESYAKKKGIRLFLQEKKNLLQRKMKKMLAENEIISEYMVKTGKESSINTVLTRITHLPILLVRLLWRNRK